jgi:hypothetical protein
MSLSAYDTDGMSRLYRRAEACGAMIRRRAVEAYWQALGGKGRAPADASLNMCVMHNCMIAFEQGRPWREVDYSAMRRAIRILDRQFEPTRIVRELIMRRMKESHRLAA